MALLLAPTLRRPAWRRPLLLARIPLAATARPQPLAAAAAATPLPPTAIPIPVHRYGKFYSSQRSNHYRYQGQHQHQHQRQQKPFLGKLREALKNTKTEWYAIPFGLGVGVVGFTQIRKNSRHEPQPPAPPAAGGQCTGGDGAGLPEHERRIRPMGSWLASSVSAHHLAPY